MWNCQICKCLHLFCQLIWMRNRLHPLVTSYWNIFFNRKVVNWNYCIETYPIYMYIISNEKIKPQKKTYGIHSRFVNYSAFHRILERIHIETDWIPLNRTYNWVLCNQDSLERKLYYQHLQYNNKYSTDRFWDKIVALHKPFGRCSNGMVLNALISASSTKFNCRLNSVLNYKQFECFIFIYRKLLNHYSIFVRMSMVLCILLIHHYRSSRQDIQNQLENFHNLCNMYKQVGSDLLLLFHLVYDHL